MRNHRTPYFCEMHHIKNQVESLSGERLLFLDGRRLGDVELREHDAATGRKLRRIIEKRVSQKYWKNAGAKDARTNYSRHATKRHLTNQMKNIYGYVPAGFVYCCAA